MKSQRGVHIFWFKNYEGEPICQKCWYETHKVTCYLCGLTDFVIYRSRNFTYKKSLNDFVCRSCQLSFYQYKSISIARKITLSFIRLFNFSSLNELTTEKALV